MLFWIFVILLIASIVWMIIDCTVNYSCLAYVTVPTFVICLAAVIISLGIMCCSYIGVDAYVAEMDARYEVLTYELENDVFDNNNDLGKQELMNKIQEWNEDLAWYKEAQDDFWIGIYIPNIYGHFEPIPLR